MGIGLVNCLRQRRNQQNPTCLDYLKHAKCLWSGLRVRVSPNAILKAARKRNTLIFEAITGSPFIPSWRRSETIFHSAKYGWILVLFTSGWVSFRPGCVSVRFFFLRNLEKTKSHSRHNDVVNTLYVSRQWRKCNILLERKLSCVRWLNWWEPGSPNQQ